MKPYHKKRRFFKEEDGVLSVFFFLLTANGFQVNDKGNLLVGGEGELCYIVKYILR